MRLTSTLNSDLKSESDLLQDPFSLLLAGRKGKEGDRGFLGSEREEAAFMASKKASKRKENNEKRRLTLVKF